MNSDEQMVSAHFGQVGEVLRVDILRELDGSSRGQALVSRFIYIYIIYSIPMSNILLFSTCVFFFPKFLDNVR